MDTRDKGIRTIAPRQTLVPSHSVPTKRKLQYITGGVEILLLLLLGPQLVDPAVGCIGKMSNM